MMIAAMALGATLAFAGAPTTGPTTGPAAVREELLAMLKQSEDLRKAGDVPAAMRLLQGRAEEMLAKVKDNADATAVLSAGLARMRAMPVEGALESGQAGYAEAAFAMTFEPRMEAELPAGFPQPGKVAVVVVKEYPAYRLARTPMQGRGDNQAFGLLFKHISTNKIEMTAPVELSYVVREGTAQPAAMAFLYGNSKIGQAGAAGQVSVVDVPAMTVVSVGVRGEYSAARLNKTRAKLDAWLADHAAEWAAAGEVRYLGYNSPFNLDWSKYGEVQIPIRKKAR